MAEVRRVRLRSGALAWRLYEDVAYSERFAEIWVMESWTAGQTSIRSCQDAGPYHRVGRIQPEPFGKGQHGFSESQCIFWVKRGLRR